MGQKDGLEGAFREAGLTPGGSIQSTEPQQPALLADDLAAEEAASEAMFGFTLDKSKGGRPPGSRNRNTEEVRRFLQALGADPLVAAARVIRGGPNFVFEQALTMSRTVKGGGDDLDREVSGMDPDKAWAIWLRCVEFIGPYVHSKQPIDLNVEQPGLAIQINVGSPDAAKAVDAATEGRPRYTLDPENSDTYAEPLDEVTQAESHTEGSSD